MKHINLKRYIRAQYEDALYAPKTWEPSPADRVKATKRGNAKLLIHLKATRLFDRLMKKGARP